MEHLELTKQINELYNKGSNIIEFIREIESSEQNSDEAILLSYEFQSGSYVKNYYNNQESIRFYTSQLAEYINRLHFTGQQPTLLEIGIGEATTFSNVLAQLSFLPSSCYGLDISWSRLYCAQQFLASQKQRSINLAAGTLFQTPYADDSFDIVYTAHSLEPNGGREQDALKELFRITGKYLLLFEPCFELANDEQKKRMLKHGYIKNLYSHAKELGYCVLEHKLLDYSLNPLNPTAVLIIEKESSASSTAEAKNVMECPISHTPLETHNSILYSPESYLMYPVIKEIPCLLPDNAIVGYCFPASLQNK